MTSLVLVAGNWIILALAAISTVLFLRIYLRHFYDLLFSVLIPVPVLVLPAVAAIGLILVREALVLPFKDIQLWLCGSSVATQFVYWLYSTHILSILIVGSFIFLMWRKYDSLFPAVYVGWLSLGLIEISFIPQHLLMIRDFVGLSWYLPFLALTVPFLLERRWFSFNRKGLYFVALAFLVQYLLIVLYPWSLTIYEPAARSFTINYQFFPDPPWISWFFMELNHVLKVLYLAAFSFIEIRRPSN